MIQEGVNSLRMAGLAKIREGAISMAEVVRVTAADHV